MGKYWWEEEEEKQKQQSTQNTSQTSSGTEQKNGYWWENENIASEVGNQITNRLNTWLQNHNNYIKNYQNRYSGRKFNHEDSYVSDSKDWLDTVNKQRLNFQAEADSILSYLDQYNGSFDPEWMKQVRNTLTESLEQQKSIASAASYDYDYWSKFTPNRENNVAGNTAEKAYNAWQEYAEDITFDVEAAMEKSKQYDTEITSIKSLLDRYNTIGENYGMGGEEQDESIQNERAQLLGSYGFKNIRDVEKKLEELQSGKWEFDNKIKYNNLYENADYADQSKVATAEQTAGFGIGIGTSWWGKGDPVYDYINDLEGARAKNRGSALSGGTPYSIYDYMEPEEISDYNYLYNTEGKDAAKEYLDYLEYTLNARRTGAVKENAAKLADEHPVLSSVISVPANLMGGVGTMDIAGQNIVKGVKESVTGEYAGPVDYNRVTMTPSAFSTSVRGAVSQNIIDSTGAIELDQNEHPVLSKLLNGKSWADVYQLGMSMADSASIALMAPYVGTAGVYLLGGSAATQGMLDAIANGATDGQALTMGILNGAFEVLFEKISLENLLKGDTKNLVKTFLKQGLVEGTEEFNTSLFNNIADILVMAEKSGYTKSIAAYMEQGLSEKEATKQALMDMAIQMGWDFVGGVASGVLMGAGGSGVNYVSNALPGSQANIDAVNEYGDRTGELIQEGLESDVGTRSNKLAQKYQKQTESGKAMTGAQIRQLLEANQDQIKPKDLKLIQQAAQKRLTDLGQTENVEQIAELATKFATGQKLSREEKSILARSKYGSRVSNELLPKNIMSGEYTTEWTEDIGTKEVNVEAYNKKKIQQLREIIEQMKSTEDSNAYKSLEERVGEDKTYAVAEDGKAAIIESDEVISLNNFVAKDITENDMTIELENGNEVKASEIEYENNDQAYLFAAVPKIENITPAAATVAINGYDSSSGLSVSEYLNGFDEGFTYGYHGYSEADLQSGEFAPKLSSELMKTAYEMGKEARKYSDETSDAPKVKMRTEADAKMTAEQKTAKQAERFVKGEAEVYFMNGESVTYFNDKKTGKIDSKRKAAVNTAKFLSKLGIGGKYYFYESYVNAAGKRVYKNANGVEKSAPNGFYKDADGSIYIDLNAGDYGQGVALFTLGHELTHFVKAQSKKQFKILSDLVKEAFDKTDLSMHERVLAKQKFLQKSRGEGENVSYDEAFEEVVADAMSTMMADGTFYDKLMEIKVKDKGLFDTIKRFFKNMIAKFTKAYEKLTPDQRDARDIREMKDMFDKIQTAFAEALVEASENFHSAMESVVEADAKPMPTDQIVTEGAVVTDGNGERQSIRSMKHDIAEGKMFEDLKNVCGWTNAQVNTLRKQLNDLVEYMIPYRDILDMNEAYGMEGRRFSPYKPNSDPLYKISMDFSTLCSKRLLTQYVIENLQLRENRPMSAEEQMAIRSMLNEYRKVEKGLQVACAMCYVEAARLKSPKQIQRWLDDPTPHLINYFAQKNTEFNNSVKEAQADFKESKGYDRNAPKKDMKPADVKELNKIGPKLRSQYQLSAEEQAIVEKAKNLPNSTYLTAGNLANLSETDPVIYAAYTSFVRTATRSKSLETDEPYYYGDSTRDNGNGIVVTDSFIEAVNRENGMRFSSWSDWRIQHLLDYITAVIDNSVRGAAMHGYTKFGDEVRVLGKTGMMFNMSGVTGTQTGLNEDGSLNFSDTESIDVNEAIQLREEFPDTAGLQCIGVSNEHITALLRSDIIDYVIPYHVSGLNAALRRMADIHGWKDYTGTQNASIDKNAKLENAVDKDHWHEEPVFSEFFVGYDTGMTGIEAMRESGKRYVQMCKDRGLVPKFEQFANEDNYWKLLIDRKMINQQTGNLIRQKAVTPTFDSNVIKGVVDKFVNNYDAGLESRALNHIVENWDTIPQKIKDLKKASKTKKSVDTLANQTVAAQPKETGTKNSDRISTGEKFSMRSPVEETADLVAFHNITPQLLMDVLNRKGLLMPSIAITNKGMNDFGEISLVFYKITIDPSANSENKLYGADAWTPTQTQLKKNAKFDTNKTVNAVNNLKNSIGSEYVQALFNITAKQFKEAIIRADGSIYDAFAHSIGMQTAYAMEKGIISEIPTTKSGKVNKTALHEQLNAELDTDNGWRQYKRWLNNISDTVITSYDKASNEDILRNMKAQPASAKTFKLSENGELVVPAAEYSSIEDMQKNKSRLSENAAEETKAVADEFLALAKEIGNNTKSVVNAINVAFADRYSTSNIVKSFESHGIKISTETAGKLQDMYKKAVELPTQYFEAKPQREVGLNEIAAVIMPKDDSLSELKSKLEELGITVTEYNAESKAERVKALNSVEKVKFSERATDLHNNAPTFYSQMGKVVEGMKQEKFGANSVISMLRGRGVKAEEIRWSGIQAFLDGKKSVTKQELLDFINSSMLQIEEEERGEYKKYSPEQQKRFGELEHEINVAWDEIWELWEKEFGEGPPMDLVAAPYLEGRITRIINNANEEAGTEISEDSKRIIELANLVDIHRREIESISYQAETPETKWSQYKVDGGENYRELVFKIPGATYSNMAMRGHWGEDAQGVLAHARMQDFDVDGKKMLFIEEIQSDWHNEGHNKGYESSEYVDYGVKFGELEEKFRNSYMSEDAWARENDRLLELEEQQRKKGIGTVPNAPFKDNYHEFVLKRLIRMAAEEGYDSIGWTTADIQSERWSDDYAEGYRIEYDQDIPKFLKKYGKQWGAEVSKTTLRNGEEVWNMNITDAMQKSVLTEGQAMYSERASNKELAQADDTALYIKNTSKANYIDMIFNGAKTEETRASRTLDTFIGKDFYVTDGKYVYGSIVLGEPHKYTEEEFHKKKNQLKHRVPIGDEYDIKPGGTKWAYPIESYEKFDKPKKLSDSKEYKNSFQARQVKYSERGEGSSNRALIENAAKNVEEGSSDQRLIQRYQDNASKLDDLNRQLGEINSEIKNVLRGSKEAKNLSALEKKAETIVNEIDRRTSLATNLENSKGLQEIIQKELETRSESLTESGIRLQEEYWLKKEVKQIEALREYRETNAELRQKQSDISVMENEFVRLMREYEKESAKSNRKDSKNTDKISNLKETVSQQKADLSTWKSEFVRLAKEYDKQQKIHERDEKTWGREFDRLVKEYEAAGRSIERLENKIVQQKENAKRIAKNRAESKERTELRHKIFRVVKELNDLLLNENKKRHVPDSLKKSVAGVLAIVNMDTVEADARVAKYADLIAKEQAKAEPDQDIIDSYTVTMENIQRQGEKIGERIKELRNAYEEIKDSTDPDIANAYDPVIEGAIKELSQTIGDTSIINMTTEQLSDVYDVYRMVLTRVRDANNALLENIKESISEMATETIKEVRSVGGEHTHRAAILDPVKKFLWNNLKPVYAMATIGSKTLTKIFNNVRAGEDTWAKDVSEARAYFLEKSKKYGYDSWDFNKKYKFESDGSKFELTLEQILSLYAYSKREQAHDHLRLGGFVFDSNIKTYKDGNKVIKYKVNIADAHQITPEMLGEITGKLTKEQMGFVDEMQEYLSTVMGAKGNEVTSKMYGVKLFKEKFYFPLKSAKQFMFEQNEVAGEVKIKNSGFTNKVVAKANNPVILSNFMDVWAGHVNDMSMYHAFTLPLEDFNRVFNYNSQKQEGVPSVAVKGTIQNAYGPAAVDYVKNLITDLNGGARTDSTTGFINKAMGLFKKGSVFASLSVTIQQPSAIARAAALVDTKYFIGPKIDHKTHKLLWDEVKQYAPVAIIKEMGYFDTNMGKSTQDFIQGKEYSGFKSKMKALVTDSNYRDEVLSKAPALADEIAWCGIWEAVKRETKANNPDMDVKSEEFLKIAGERFTEVITKTQVYDSVLARSANMRSKDTGMKMATAFMAEPTTSINIIADALLQGKRGNKKYSRKAIGAVVASQLLNAILVSIVYAGRDDDEDETYVEKYIGSVTGELLDSLNPADYIPFIKDIVSIVKGYDVERSDMAVISDLWKSIQNLKSEKVSPYRKVEGFAGSIAQIFGLPVKNIMRDARGIYQTVTSFVDKQYTTGSGIKYATISAVTGKDVPKQQQIYDVILSGDAEYLERLKQTYKDEDAYHSAVRKALRDNDPRIREAAQAYYDGNIEKYKRIFRQIQNEIKLPDFFNDIMSAVMTEVSDIKGETEPKNESSDYSSADFVNAILVGDTGMAEDMREDIIQFKLKDGKTQEEAEESFAASVQNATRNAFDDDRLDDAGAKNMLLEYADMDEEEAEAKVEYWNFVKENPKYKDDFNQSRYEKYRDFAEPADIPLGIFVQYVNRTAGIETIKDEWGDEVMSVREQVLDVIDSLDLTWQQKDALYLAHGYAESKIFDVPW